jgi:hypothetical protein
MLVMSFSGPAHGMSVDRLRIRAEGCIRGKSGDSTASVENHIVKTMANSVG